MESMFPARWLLLFVLFAVAEVRGQTIDEIQMPFTKVGTDPGSTHEITFDESRKSGPIWVTGQNYGVVVEISLDGKTITPHPVVNPGKQGIVVSAPIGKDGAGPHGIEFDAAGNIWLTLEFLGVIVKLDSKGQTLAEFDVNLPIPNSKAKLNQHPHGLGIGRDGKTVWFTGKGTGTIGRIAPDGQVSTFGIPTVGSVPIYIKAGPDGNMWFTELVGNKIGRITPQGEISEYKIPTANSRPIAIIPAPDGQAMWFTEEAGQKVARIDLQGKITEFPIPATTSDMILAGLTFDGDRNLWVQQYVNASASCHSTGGPASAPFGPDYVIKVDKKILTAKTPDLSGIAFTYFQVPSRDTVMHRIIAGPDGKLWFTELNTNKVGRVTLK